MKRLFAILLLAVSTAASAQAYLYGAIGQSKADISKSELDADVTAIVGVAPSSSTIDNTDTGFKLQAGYRFSRNLALEGGWVDLGRATYHAIVAGISLSQEVKASGLNIAAVGILPVNDRFSLFGKFGLINAKVNASATASVPGLSVSASASDTSLKNNYGFGATYDLASNLSVRAEWERFADLGDKDKTGQADVDLLSVGLMYRF